MVTLSFITMLFGKNVSVCSFLKSALPKFWYAAPSVLVYTAHYSNVLSAREVCVLLWSVASVWILYKQLFNPSSHHWFILLLLVVIHILVLTIRKFLLVPKVKSYKHTEVTVQHLLFIFKRDAQGPESGSWCGALTLLYSTVLHSGRKIGWYFSVQLGNVGKTAGQSINDMFTLWLSLHLY